MKYSKNFTRDFKWYIKVRHFFNFDGHENRPIVYDRNGIDGKKAFHIYDSQGVLKPTKHPKLLAVLIKAKGSVNLHIKMYAEDRAKGLLPLFEFRELCDKLADPYWFFCALEKSKNRIIQHDSNAPEFFKFYSNEKVKKY